MVILHWGAKRAILTRVNFTASTYLAAAKSVHLPEAAAVAGGAASPLQVSTYLAAAESVHLPEAAAVAGGSSQYAADQYIPCGSRVGPPP